MKAAVCVFDEWQRCNAPVRLIRKGHDEEVHTVTAAEPPFYKAFLNAVKTDTDFSALSALGVQLTDSALTAGRSSAEGLFNVDVYPQFWGSVMKYSVSFEQEGEAPASAINI